MNHDTVRVKSPWGFLPIDRAIAPLLKEVWKAGIMTCQCCQEREPGRAWIVFPGTDDVEEFLYVCQRRYRPRLEMWDEGEGGELSTCMNLYVLFPVADLPELVIRFKTWNRRPASERGAPD